MNEQQKWTEPETFNPSIINHDVIDWSLYDALSIETTTTPNNDFDVNAIFLIGILPCGSYHRIHSFPVESAMDIYHSLIDSVSLVKNLAIENNISGGAIKYDRKLSTLSEPDQSTFTLAVV